MAASAATRLRKMLTASDIVVAPGAYDGLSAKMIEEAGFAAVYCTGGGISRSRGQPDLGYTTLTELVERIGSMTETCPLPMIVDADSGFGGVLNLRRAVRALERVDAAAVHIEDLEVPNRRRQAKDNLVEPKEMEARLRAALGARQNPDFLVIGRTDVLPMLGLPAAIERTLRFAGAGADMVYIDGIKTRAQMEELGRKVNAPKLIGIIAGECEQVPAADLAQMGFKLLTIPADPQLAAIHAVRRLLAHIKNNGSSAGFDALCTFEERDALVDTHRHREIEHEYLP
ncbi:MAG: isocitrate lyase/PEP mutase family protein [Alphaproteobacteria bacterium]|nr:isocitrate lyase/PEP mutase family protein [Alphaproteobacteria bacterium]